MANSNSTQSPNKGERAKKQPDPNLIRWILQTEGVGLEHLDNEAIYQPAVPPSFEATEPKVTPVQEFIGSITFDSQPLSSPEPVKSQIDNTLDAKFGVILNAPWPGAESLLGGTQKATEFGIKIGNEVAGAGADLVKQTIGLGEYHPPHKPNPKPAQVEGLKIDTQALQQRKVFVEGITQESLRVALMEDLKEGEKILEEMAGDIAKSPSLAKKAEEVRRKPKKTATDFRFLRSISKGFVQLDQKAKELPVIKGKAAPGESQITDANKQGERTAGGTILTAAG